MSHSFASRATVRRTGAMVFPASRSASTAPALAIAPCLRLAFIDKQAVVANHGTVLTGRHRPPTGAPTPFRQWGGEGTQFTRGRCAIDCLEVLTMPSLHLRFITSDQCGTVSFHYDKEGIFLFVWPFEVALIWPGVQT